MKKQYSAIAGIAAYYILAGIDFIIIETVTQTIPTILMITFRLMICALAMGLFAIIRKIRFSFTKREMVSVLICSLLGIVLYYIMEAIGIHRTSGSVASLILATIPIFGIIFGHLVFKEEVSRKGVICSMLSIVGVVLVVLGNEQGSFFATLSGVGIMVLTAIIWALYIVAVKPIKEKKPLGELTVMLFLMGGILSLPLFIWSKPALLCNLSALELGLTVASAIICIAFGQLVYIFGVEKVSVGQSSLFANLLPITTVLFSFLILGTSLSLLQIIGGIVILGSVTISSR